MPSFENDDAFLMNYTIDGPDGAPWIVLSNSLGSELALWEPQLATLSAHYRVLRYDTRGHGETDVSAGAYTIAQLGQDVLSLMDHLDIAQADFCGISMGGVTGMWLALNHPQRIGRLVLANTAAQIATPAVWNTRMETIASAGMQAIIPAVLERWFTPGYRESAPEQVARVRAMLSNTVSGGYIGCCAALRDVDLRDQVSAIRHPTLVIAGTHDTSTPADDGRWLAEQIPGAQYLQLDCAHISNWEKADEFNAALTGFLHAA